MRGTLIYTFWFPRHHTVQIFFFLSLASQYILISLQNRETFTFSTHHTFSLTLSLSFSLHVPISCPNSSINLYLAPDTVQTLYFMSSVFYHAFINFTLVARSLFTSICLHYKMSTVHFVNPFCHPLFHNLHHFMTSLDLCASTPPPLYLHFHITLIAPSLSSLNPLPWTISSFLPFTWTPEQKVRS